MGVNVTDHLGNRYATIEEMCAHYQITPKAFYGRKSRGWSLERALTTPLKKRVYTDHLGNTYDTLARMCEAYGIPASKYAQRKHLGWTTEEILTTPIGQRRNPDTMSGKIMRCEDHLGNTYTSVERMCRHYNIRPATYLGRRKRGWTLEKALTTPVGQADTAFDRFGNTGESCTDHLGNRYESERAMCAHYGIPYGVYTMRRSFGWSVQDALTKKP